MTMIKALAALRPGAQWAMKDGSTSVDDLTWLDTEQTKPNQAEVDAEIARLQGPEAVFAEGKAAVFSKFRADREMFLNRLMGIAGRLARAGNTSIATNADSVAEQLIALTAFETVVAATSLEELREAMQARYRAIIATADPLLHSAFRQVDAWAMLNDSNYKTLFDAEQLIRPMRAKV